MLMDGSLLEQTVVTIPAQVANGALSINKMYCNDRLFYIFVSRDAASFCIHVLSFIDIYSLKIGTSKYSCMSILSTLNIRVADVALSII